jgi:hypothetical protein
MNLNIGDQIRFNKKTKKSIKDFFIASLIDVEKIYSITAIEKCNKVIIVEVEDSDGSVIHCPIDENIKFFNKKTPYRLFRRANGTI